MQFQLERFFAGHLSGWGIQESRLGKLQSKFKIKARGVWDASSKTLSLKETYTFDDGHLDTLDWQIVKVSASEYVGHETRIEGEAKGRSDGGVFTWRYSRRVPAKGGDETSFDFHDKFYLIDANSLVARASVSRLFFEVATMSVFYSRD